MAEGRHTQYWLDSFDRVVHALAPLCMGGEDGRAINDAYRLLLAQRERMQTISADTAALDRIAHMLRDPEWGVGMLEDIAGIVARTGRSIESLPGNERTWEVH